MDVASIKDPASLLTVRLAAPFAALTAGGAGDGASFSDYSTLTDPGIVATGPAGNGTVAGATKLALLGRARSDTRHLYADLVEHGHRHSDCDRAPCVLRRRQGAGAAMSAGLVALARGFLDGMVGQGHSEAEVAEAMLAVALLTRVRAAASPKAQAILAEHEDEILEGVERQLTAVFAAGGGSLAKIQ